MSAVMYQVKIANISATISCRAGQTVLQASMAAGIDYPFACASGNCGVCISQLDAGKVSMLPRADATLSAEQIASGKTLACRARPRSDVEVTWLGRGRR
jgi:ferredoxin